MQVTQQIFVAEEWAKKACEDLHTEVQSRIAAEKATGARAVHGSSQPGFGPNPHSTRLDRVTEKRTRNQLKNGLNPPGRIIGLNWSNHRFERVGPLIGPFL